VLYISGKLEGVYDCRMVDLGDGVVVVTLAGHFLISPPMLRLFWRLFRPVIDMAHRVVMLEGRRSVQRELDRRRVERGGPLLRQPKPATPSIEIPERV
jgi:hypothetical protein